MNTRIQIVISEDEAKTIFEDIRLIIPKDKAIIGITDNSKNDNSKLLIVLTDDNEIEFMLKLKYAGCETNVMRF